MDQQNCNSSKFCEVFSLRGLLFGESVERAEPGGFCGVAVDEDDDGDGAGPVAVALIAGHEG